jgi:hypothetical protein
MGLGLLVDGEGAMYPAKGSFDAGDMLTFEVGISGTELSYGESPFMRMLEHGGIQDKLQRTLSPAWDISIYIFFVEMNAPVRLNAGGCVNASPVEQLRGPTHLDLKESHGIMVPLVAKPVSVLGLTRSSLTIEGSRQCRVKSPPIYCASS